jgi:hypothetical protein
MARLGIEIDNAENATRPERNVACLMNEDVNYMPALRFLIRPTTNRAVRN